MNSYRGRRGTKWKAFARGSTLCGAILIALPGCEKEDVKAYKAPKDTASPHVAMERDHAPVAGSSPSSATGGAPAAGNGASVAFTAPATWKSVQSEQAMRIATFRAGTEPGVEVIVSAFPGDVGGPLANVNRWCGQVGAAPVVEGDLAAMLETTDVGGVKISTLRIKGQPQDMLAAMITPGDGQTWFVKSVGAPAALDAIRDEFVAFAKTFRMSAASGAATTTSPVPSPSGAPKTETPANAAAASAGGSVEARLAQWTPPTTWAKEANASGFLTAAYSASNGSGGARITASNLTGEGGGLLNNINRWRGQVGLSPVASLDQQAMSKLGSAALVDLVDGDGKMRMMVAVLSAGDRTWYFKLTGTPAAVDAERQAFEKFVRTTGLGEP